MSVQRKCLCIRHLCSTNAWTSQTVDSTNTTDTIFKSQVWIVLNGMEAIRLLEKYSAPLLIALSIALLAWAVTSAGGLGPMLSAPSQFGLGMPKEGKFWSVFWPAG